MPLPLYFCVFASALATAAQAGLHIAAYCGSFAEEGCRLVPQLPSETDFAIFTDFNPTTKPEAAAETLCAYCRKAGITRLFFDFERPCTPEAARFFAAFSAIRPAALQIIVPERYADKLDAGLVLCSVRQPCSSWESRMTQFQTSYGESWCLELTPWRSIPADFLPRETAALHPQAKCHLHLTGSKPALWDSRHSLAEKCAVAAGHGCRFALGLLSELDAYCLTE